MNYKTMGDLICDLRKQKNMTQKELADQLNVTDKAVSKWERGISYPDILMIPRLSSVLSISVEQLMHFQNDISKEQKQEPIVLEKIEKASQLVFKAVGMAMGVAVLVLSVVGNIRTSSAITLLAIGVACIGISQFQNK